MPEREQIIGAIEELRRSLFNVNMQFASHVKEVHQGIPASTCHPCLNFIAGINNIEYYIKKNEGRISALQETTIQPDVQNEPPL